MVETIVAMFTAVVVLISAVVGLVAKREVRKIHVMVNSRMDEALARIDQLDEALHEAGVVSPDRPPRDD